MTSYSFNHRLLATDRSHSVLASHSGGIRHNSYSAHGFRPLSDAVGPIGFNGEFQEHNGVYLLGSYRAYSPLLMQFYSPDSLSPFGKGGLNAYAYCLGDPVNRVDPTGHLPWWGWMAVGVTVPALGGAVVGSVMGMAGMMSMQIAVVASTAAVGVEAAAIVAPEGRLQDTLSWAGLALGVVAGAGVVGATFKTVAPSRYRGVKKGLQDLFKFRRRPGTQGRLNSVEEAALEAADRNYLVKKLTTMRERVALDRLESLPQGQVDHFALQRQRVRQARLESQMDRAQSELHSIERALDVRADTLSGRKWIRH